MTKIKKASYYIEKIVEVNNILHEKYDNILDYQLYTDFNHCELVFEMQSNPNWSYNTKKEFITELDLEMSRYSKPDRLDYYVD
jgi:hypothetical protein